MPMMKCADCGKEMSDAAPACPSCGRPNGQAVPTVRPVGLLLGLGIFLFPVIFAWFTLQAGRTTKAKAISFIWLGLSLLIFLIPERNNSVSSLGPTSSTSRSSISSADAPKVDIRRLLSDYKNNEVGADNRYKGSVVEVTGTVDDIKKDILGNLYVTLGTGKDFEIPRIQAFFDDSMNYKLGRLYKGQQLTVVCRIKGLMLNVLGEDCVIE